MKDNTRTLQILEDTISGSLWGSLVEARRLIRLPLTPLLPLGLSAMQDQHGFALQEDEIDGGACFRAFALNYGSLPSDVTLSAEAIMELERIFAAQEREPVTPARVRGSQSEEDEAFAGVRLGQESSDDSVVEASPSEVAVGTGTPWIRAGERVPPRLNMERVQTGSGASNGNMDEESPRGTP